MSARASASSDTPPLPPGWAVAPVGDIVTLVNGFAFTPHHWGNQGLPIVRIQNLNNPNAPFNYTTAEIPDKFRIQTGDVLFAWSGTPGTSFGAHIWKGGDALLNQHIFKVCFDRALIDPEFLRLSINHNLDSYIKQAQGGSGLAHITKRAFEASHLLIAPLNEQRRVVKAVRDLFEESTLATEALERAKEKAKQSRMAVLQDAITGALTSTWREHHPATESPSKHLDRILAQRRRAWESMREAVFAASKKPPPKNWRNKYDEPEPVNAKALPMLPKGWGWASIEQVGLVQLGRQRSPKHHTGKHMRPYLRVANVFEDRLDLSDVLKMNFTPVEFATYRLQFGDILLNEGQSVELVGRPAIFRDEVPNCCFQNTLIRFRAVDGVIPEYALLVFRAYLHNERFQAVAQWTTNIAHLSAGRFSQLEFPLPPLSEQKRIASEAAQKLAEIEAGEQAIDAGLVQAGRLRRNILDHAFQGKLIAPDPSDEPALVLIERIRQQKASADTKSNSRSTISNARKEKSMSGPQRRPLLEVLGNHRKGLSPEELLREAGYRLDQVDEFYSDLRACASDIEETRPPLRRIKSWPKTAHIVLRLKRT